jgi:hypothetical protein
MELKKLPEIKKDANSNIFPPDEHSLSLNIHRKKKKGETNDSDLMWNFSESDDNYFENSLNTKAKTPFYVFLLSYI